MAPGALAALIFIINSFAQLYLLVLLLRLLMPWMGANYHNPISQAILKLTSPPGDSGAQAPAAGR
jgi:uncharacterized protein YggT (Ycf19 family)